MKRGSNSIAISTTNPLWMTHTNSVHSSHTSTRPTVARQYRTNKSPYYVRMINSWPYNVHFDRTLMISQSCEAKNLNTLDSGSSGGSGRTPKSHAISIKCTPRTYLFYVCVCVWCVDEDDLDHFGERVDDDARVKNEGKAMNGVGHVLVCHSLFFFHFSLRFMEMRSSQTFLYVVFQPK